MGELSADQHRLLLRLRTHSVLTFTSEVAEPGLDELEAAGLVSVRRREVRLQRLDGLVPALRTEARLTEPGRALAAQLAAQQEAAQAQPGGRRRRRLFGRGR